jgi:hypothetical protein
MVNKKGLSNIVATVLIVLLVLAAIVLVWNVIRPAIENTGEQIDIKTQCLSVDVKPTICTNSSTQATVTYQIFQGVPLFKVVAIVENPAGQTFTDTDSAPPGTILTTATIGPFAATGTGVMTATTAAVLQDSNGNEVTCDAVAVPIDCV